MMVVSAFSMTIYKMSTVFETKVLLITGCRDQSMWYSKYVGHYVPLLDDGNDTEFKSLEPSGYINFVLRKDCMIIDSSDSNIKFYGSQYV